MNIQYYPKIDEFLSLFCFVIFLLLVGNVIKSILLQRKDLSKFSFIFLIWIAVIVSYAIFSGYLFLKAEHSHRLVTLGWALLFWFIPMFYYSFFFVNIVSSQMVERPSPIGDKIGDPSPFADARKLALIGDIDGAIALYRSYKDNQVEALFEAFRLLKSKGRHEEAYQTLQEIIDRHGDKVSAWVEAKYYQAKIKSAIFKEYDEAIQLYKQILKKRPKTPFHTIASNEIARLQAICKTDLSINDDETHLHKQEIADHSENSLSQHFSKEDKKKYILAVEDTFLGNYVPPDPFFKGDIKQVMKEIGENLEGKKKKKTRGIRNKNLDEETNNVKEQKTRKEKNKKEQNKKRNH